MKKRSHLSPIYFAVLGAVLFTCSAGSTTPNAPTQVKENRQPIQQQIPQGTRAATPQLEAFRYELADLADRLIPTVVNIQTEATVKVNNFGGFRGDDFFEYFFNFGFGNPRQQQKPREHKKQGQGSGVIVSSSGQILTNNHVVAGADQITVTLADKREFKAKIVGTDSLTDVAVIQIESEVKELPVAALGNSDALRVGEWVIAIGNPFGLSQTVTKGIVSAKDVHGRGLATYENFIQTDAAINPGNSGGGLFNLSGELVGINSAIFTRSGGFQGIGFAIPTNLVTNVMNDLLADGKVSRGWLGVNIQDINPSLAKALNLNPAKGALIAEVFNNSPAAKGGIKAGDVVRSINGKILENANDLRNTVAALRPGESAEFEVLRDGKKMKLKVTIALREENNLAGIMPGTKSDKNEQKQTPAKNKWGVEAAELTKAQKQAAGLAESFNGMVITSIEDKSPADKATLKKGDIILTANNRPMVSLKDFNAVFDANSKTLLLLIRRSESQFFTVLEE
ncbi:MAG: DegQ family serine endoprotease [Fibromonadaceae bacterium]|jgi:serine protease Do|nr:DegQ family serine endoprotease [Fibromonadaceae bacterium]